jgi:urease accessory protein
MNAPVARGLADARVAQRSGRLDLAFIRCGPRTRIGPQFASYPFHLTRSFDLDPAIPQLTTVYLQSSSGGLYGGERLAAEIRVGKGAAAHVTSQAATIVHNARGNGTTQETMLAVETGAFLAVTPDPLVLFPGAHLVTTTRLQFGHGSVALLTETIAEHRPAGDWQPFERYKSAILVSDEAGRLLVSDRMAIEGTDLARVNGGGDRRWNTTGTALLLGATPDLPPPSAVVEAIEAPSSVGGVTVLPNEAGLAVRILAMQSGTIRNAFARLFALVVAHRFGAPPAQRRK